MQQLALPTVNEIIVISVSVLLGTISYLGYIIIHEKQKVSFWRVFLMLFMNCTVTYMASEAMKMWGMGAYRTIFLTAIAYSGQYIFVWYNKKRTRVFDSLAGKVGIDTKDKEHEGNSD